MHPLPFQLVRSERRYTESEIYGAISKEFIGTSEVPFQTDTAPGTSVLPLYTKNDAVGSGINVTSTG
jgi:hypothetical protein